MSDVSSWLGFERYAVFGMGVSGVAAARALVRRGKHVVLSDLREPREGLAASLEGELGCEVVIGRNVWRGCQVVVASPGMKPSLGVFGELASAGVPVIGEVELACALSRAPLVGITGTDGKTTTTTLVGHMMAVAGREHVVAGNIGVPLCEVVEGVSEGGVIVAEVSAFQLWSCHLSRFAAAGITNIAADHLDYFGTMDEYIDAKRRLFDLVPDGGLSVLNALDAQTSGWGGRAGGRVCWYGPDVSCVPSGEDGLWVSGDGFAGRWGGEELGVWCEGVGTLPLVGAHQRLNMLCASALAMSQGVEVAQIVEALRSFKPLAHRMERVGTHGEVVFWDDSKATNVHAALAGLRTLESGRALVVIAGGVDKGLELSEFASFLASRAMAVVVIGAISARLVEALGGAGMGEERVVCAQTMEEAVACAVRLVGERGDVSLSPACSSFDMFRSYAHRGEVFQAAVRAIGVD